MPPTRVKENLVDSEDALLGQIDRAARDCQTVPELTAVEALRHQIYKDSISNLRSECSDLKRRLKALEDIQSAKAERKAEERRRREEEETRRRDEEERLKREEEERKLKEELERIERLHHICSDSKIMTEEYRQNLERFFEPYKDQIYSWRLLYRGTEHGFNAKAFHKACDKKGPTITIVHNSLNKFYGGFTKQQWDKS